MDWEPVSCLKIIRLKTQCLDDTSDYQIPEEHLNAGNNDGSKQNSFIHLSFHPSIHTHSLIIVKTDQCRQKLKDGKMETDSLGAPVCLFISLSVNQSIYLFICLSTYINYLTLP